MIKPDYDMIIIGAGISGISAAVHFQKMCPGKTYKILEAKSELGGTWALFKYPGIRSDSDMHTLGFAFKPWKAEKAIADGPSILNYLHETVDEYGIRDNIAYNKKVVASRWTTEDAIWEIETADGEKVTTRFLFACSGYYSYDNPHNPTLQGEENFKGKIVHPQLWDENLDYTGKKVVIIGSGATAVTLLPNIAEKAAHTTMLQRSPSYMLARPSKDIVSNILGKILPEKWAYNITRKKNIFMQRKLFELSRKNPEKAKEQLINWTKKELGDDYPMDPNFNPEYYPWEQRLCLVPDGDLYDTLKSGKGNIVTGHIETFTDNAIQLKSGETLEADIIIKATGLNIQFIIQSDTYVDGREVIPREHFNYEAMMLSDVPNSAMTFGYINASWTLRADLVSQYVCRLVNRMDELGMRQVTARAPEGMKAQDWITIFDAGYIKRVMERLPKQGDRDPWLNEQDYGRDQRVFLKEPLSSDLEFSNPIAAAQVAAE